jgi:hypothetical protein
MVEPNVIASDKFIYSQNGLQIHPDVSYEEWAAYGRYLGRGYSAMQWAIGDWINFGEHKFGEMYAQALNDTDLAYGTLRNYASICARIPSVNRDPRLRFHQIKHVACLELDEQQRVIASAAHLNLTGDDILETVNKITGKKSQSHESFEGVIVRLYAQDDGQYFVIKTEADLKMGQHITIKTK